MCDLDEERAINASNISKGTPYFTDAELMLRKVQPDVVDIVTTAPSHYHLAKLASLSKYFCNYSKNLWLPH